MTQHRHFGTLLTALVVVGGLLAHQALGYKNGQLKILALREEARQALGDAFDIRDFNQQVLDVASAPLPYIETTVRNWIAASLE